MIDKVDEFVNRLVSDKELQKKFLSNPAQMCRELGIPIPAMVHIVSKLKQKGITKENN